MVMDFPIELKYSREHEWVRVEDDTAYIGISSYAQDALGDIVFLELPEVGDEFEKGDVLGVVESVKAVSDLYAPVTGEIVQVNEPLVDSPETINDDPYDDGWIVAMKFTDREELDELLDAAAYEKYIKEIAEA